MDGGVELCTEGSNQNHPKKKRKKAKWLPEDALQSAEKKRSKRKGEREVHPTECRVPEKARRDQKAALSEQYKKVEENNRMGNTRDISRKIGDIERTFHARMGTVKARNDKDLTE